MIMSEEKYYLDRFKEMLHDLPVWKVVKIKNDLVEYEGDHIFIEECEKEISKRKEKIS